MKKIILIIGLFLLSININAQENLKFEKVINTDSVGKTILFVTINDWFASTYNSANDVIQMADKEAGILIGNGSMDFTYGKLQYLCYEGYIKYSIKVYVKDSRFKVVLTNFKHFVDPGHGSQCALGMITTAEIYTTKGMAKKYHNKVWNDIKEVIKNYSNKTFNSIENHIKTMKLENIEDDW